MQTHLIAPPELIPLIAARLAFNPPSSPYCLHPLQAQPLQLDHTDLAILVQNTHTDVINSARACTEHIAELVIVPTPMAISYGFIALASGANTQLNLASEFIDCLAPVKNGWLHFGDLGACCFLMQLWTTLITPHGTAPFLEWNPQLEKISTQKPLNQADLVAQLATFMAQQQLQSQALSSLAKKFLADLGQQTTFEPHHAQSNILFTLNSELSHKAPIVQLAEFLAQL